MKCNSCLNDKILLLIYTIILYLNYTFIKDKGINHSLNSSFL